jgi:hypothetical protein
MDDQTKLNFAVTRFAAFVSNLPLSPDEDDILEYHEIVRLFEEAFRQDLSHSQLRRAEYNHSQAEERSACIAEAGKRGITRRILSSTPIFAVK